MMVGGGGGEGGGGGGLGGDSSSSISMITISSSKILSSSDSESNMPLGIRVQLLHNTGPFIRNPLNFDWSPKGLISWVSYIDPHVV